jgi:hypothetical protein
MDKAQSGSSHGPQGPEASVGMMHSMTRLPHSSFAFVIVSSFVLRHSSSVIQPPPISRCQHGFSRSQWTA